MIAVSGLFYASYIALWVLVILMAAIMVVLLRHFGLVTMGTLDGVQRDGLEVGATAPQISAVTAGGAPYRLDANTHKARFLLFGATECEPCGKVLPYVAMLSEAMRSDLDVTVVVPGPPSAAALMGRELNRPVPESLNIVADEDSGAADQ